MRRANKILMATVAILLCLVLITTSVVSGVFAKYAIKKQASTSVGLEKFGVELGITVQPELITTVGTNNVVTVNDGENVSVTITNLTMSPGMKFYDAIKIHADGHTTVATQFKMTFSISFTQDDFKVDGTSRMPLGFRLTAFNSSGERIHDKVAVAHPFLDYTPTQLSYTVPKNMATYINFTHKKDITNYSTNYITKDFAADTDVVFKTEKLTTNVDINDFSVGFYYPFDATGETGSHLTGSKAVNIDKWSTALASNGKNLTATINYTISLTQTS